LRVPVAISKNGSAYEQTKRIFTLLGVENSISPQDKVLVKPNLVRVPSDSPYANADGAYEHTLSPEGDLVHNEVIESVLQVLHEMKVRNIIVGEASGGAETPVVFKSLGLHELATKYGAELIDLNYAEASKVSIKDGLVLKYAWIPKIVLDADYSINVAVSKVHGFTAVTLALKNWGLGILPGKYYGINKTGRYKQGIEGPLPMHEHGDRTKLFGQEVSSSKVIVDVCSAVKCDLNIVDGLTTLHNEPGAKSYWAKPLLERTNMIIASHDIVATDAVCSRIFGFNPEKILHIKWAADKGIGNCDLSQIDVLGQKIEDVEIRCNPLASQASFIKIN